MGFENTPDRVDVSSGAIEKVREIAQITKGLVEPNLEKILAQGKDPTDIEKAAIEFAEARKVLESAIARYNAALEEMLHQVSMQVDTAEYGQYAAGAPHMPQSSDPVWRYGLSKARIKELEEEMKVQSST